MFIAIKVPIFLVLLACSITAVAQEVSVSPTKGGIALSVSAQKSYELMPGETKVPILSIECLHKGSKTSHLVVFLPGGTVADDSGGTSTQAEEAFVVTVNGTKQVTSWATYGENDGYAYVGKTETERLQFMDSLLASPTVSIEFKPFLTGTPTTTVFDLSKMREAMNKQPMCNQH
jgi:hypothetical protein